MEQNGVSYNMAYKPKVLTVAEGGTGNATQAAFSLVAGGTTTTGSFQAISDVATGQVLVSGGTGALPAFSAAPTVTSITFGAGNALSNYISSTSFTPTVTFGGASVGITYSTQSGSYVRIGAVVFFLIAIILSNKGSSTGNMSITGLPITPALTSQVSSKYGNVTYTGNEICAQVNFSAGVTLLTCTTATTNVILTDVAFANNSFVSVSGCYFV